MRSLFIKGITAALFAASIAPFASGQSVFNEHFVVAQTGTRGIQATVPAYDNTTTFLGGYASGITANQSGNTITALIADDIMLAPGFGGLAVTNYAFVVTNPNTVSVSARARTRFWLPDGPDGSPGTYIIGYSSTTAIAFGANTYTTVTFTITPGQFVLPAGGKLWAGLTYDDFNGTSLATPAQLALFGVGIFGPPTVGSSTNVLYQTTAAGSFLANNPAGAPFQFTNNTPLANAGWRFTAPAFTLSGVIDLQGAVNKAQPVTFDFKIGGVSQFTRTVTLGTDGSFALTDVPAKTYDVFVKGAKWLRKSVNGVNLTLADVTTFAATLKAGDATNDNAADISDLLVLINSYNKISPAEGYSEAADFNTDGSDDITDLLLLIGNYNQLGD